MGIFNKINFFGQSKARRLKKAVSDEDLFLVGSRNSKVNGNIQDRGIAAKTLKSYFSGVSTFLGLTDTPSSYGLAGSLAAVNDAGDGLKFVSGAGAGYENVLNHTLTPNEIAGLTLTPFEVIPQPLQSAIFDFKIVFRFVAGTGAYGGGGLDLLLINSNPYFTIPTESVIALNSAMIQELKDGGMIVYGNHSADIAGYEQITPQPSDNRFLLTTNGVQITVPELPLVGGTLYIDVYYNIIPIQ